MKQVCSCGKVLGEVPDPANTYGIKNPVSHGICPACAERLYGVKLERAACAS